MAQALILSKPQLSVSFALSEPVGHYRQSDNSRGPVITRISVRVEYWDYQDRGPVTGRLREPVIYLRFGFLGYLTEADAGRPASRNDNDYVLPDYRNVREYRVVLAEAFETALDFFLNAFPQYRGVRVEQRIRA